MEKVVRFFNAIPKAPAGNGHLKCYRKGTSAEIILELGLPERSDGRKFTREGLIRLLGTYFVVQEIRDLAQHHVSFTLVDQNLDGKERSRVTVHFHEILPFFNGHDF